MAPFPATRDLPQGAGFIFVKIALVFFYCMGLRPWIQILKTYYFFTEMWPSPRGRRAVGHGGRGLVSTFNYVCSLYRLRPVIWRVLMMKAALIFFVLQIC